MNNFIFGIGSISRGISFTIKSISQYQLFWGFAFGFLVSTLVHGFLISGNPKDVPTILFRDQAAGFQKIYANQRKKDGTYQVSFTDFAKIASKVKFIFALSFFIFFLIVLVALFKF